MDISRGSLSCLPHHTSLTYVRFIRYLWVMGTSSKLKCHKTKRKPAMGIRWPWFYKHGEAVPVGGAGSLVFPMRAAEYGMMRIAVTVLGQS